MAREWSKDARVVVTKGLSKGRRGTVIKFWNNITVAKERVICHYEVKLDGDLATRVIRGDWLEQCVEKAS
jgi:hypothetical protein